ncbi:MAG: HlyD family type I secretion periplasmic adaptor subunit [Alphaproteobacteria bacterium]|nr:HlyD family type I secretion periplasmic adaptor subunit [Alphaproteobacteria bacterium]MBU1279678.1 HlyD family type I secretion periplasmic adaptor subunit [Alphaproteobacteria bacterium]MBU1572002.1 HlyD family type I secretion periplasmic adaptor subunit [Alphaproteobacteria bacterium]MBU1830203.1 HlyD family type I secretion periplasmic adaptor subunit [Alphaproteobacteria bacterium]MBU2078659.1 HlyD family type I secretion periplasmic adaptor subunit [Alphaproteobacteria bacterium]
MATFDDMLDKDMDRPGWIIRISAVVIVIFLLWAAIARVDEIVRSDGEMISSSRPQIVQNLEGGILSELLVHEGQEVEQGQVLAKLQGTEFRTSVDDLQEKIDALEVRRLRLEAELEGEDAFVVSDDLAARAATVLASEKALLKARVGDYLARKDGAMAVLKQAETERSLMEDMLTKNVVSLIEVTRARKSHSDAQLKYNEIVTQAELQRAEDYSDTLKELASVKQALTLANDQLGRTVIVAPMRGIVNSLMVTTIGGVIRPGEELVQIIPVDEELFVEARVRPEDIAHVQPGQDATIKLSAYDYTIFGSLKGKVQVVSADTFKDERDSKAEPYYRVTATVDLSSLTERQQQIEIRPGMRAQVELHTGSKTFLQYLLKPLYKSREAFREP